MAASSSDGAVPRTCWPLPCSGMPMTKVPFPSMVCRLPNSNRVKVFLSRPRLSHWASAISRVPPSYFRCCASSLFISNIVV